MVQCAASVSRPPARVNKGLYWGVLGPGHMRKIPHVLGQEGVSTGLDGSEVCRLGVSPHGYGGCFFHRDLFFGALGRGSQLGRH